MYVSGPHRLYYRTNISQSILDLIGRCGGGEASRRIDCVTHEEILR